MYNLTQETKTATETYFEIGNFLTIKEDSDFIEDSKLNKNSFHSGHEKLSMIAIALKLFASYTHIFPLTHC